MVNKEQRPTAGPATTGAAPPNGAPASGPTTRARTASAPKAPTAPQTPGVSPTPRRRDRRPEMIQKRREERYRQYERQKRQWFYTKIGLGVAAVLVVVAAGFVVWSIVQGRIDEAMLDDVQEFDYTDTSHQEGDLTYAENPPVGGPHNAVWQNCGYYEAPVAEENVLHSLEHGAVWITYRPDLPVDQIEELKEKADSASHILVSPRPDLPAPIVLSGWNRQLQLDSVDDRAFDAFVRTYRGGAQVPEPGARCDGGTSATLPA